KNPYPEYPDYYTDWKWNILNDSILRIKTSYSVGIVDENEYYYFLIDRENNCLSFIIAKFRGGEDVIFEEPEEGEIVYDDRTEYSLNLQYWEEDDKFVGHLVPDNPDYIVDNQRFFWVELIAENYEAQTEDEDYWGL
ncbi:MAG: hypothetical protein WCY89_11335, partial [Flavobacteriaceae bacterium]